MEGPGSDEQDVVGAHHPMLGGDGAALDQGQQIALDALPGDIGAAAVVGAPADLVDLVEEDDALLFHPLQGAQLQLLLVDALGRLLVAQQLHGVRHLELAPLGAIAAQILEQALELAGHVLHARRGHDLDANGRGTDLDLHLALVQFPPAQLVAELLPGGAGGPGTPAVLLEVGRRRQQGVEHPLLGGGLGLIAQPLHGPLAGHLDRRVGQVADDGLHVPPHVAHLGELGRLDLDEGGVGQLGQAPGDLGLAHAGGADHENVLGRDLRAHGLRDLGPAPAVAQGHGHGALGLLLTDDMLVELGDDTLRGDVRHGGRLPGEGSGVGQAGPSSSMVRLWLV